ncbi:SH3 domain-containing protein [Prosthecobacter sp.]|uniref:SH3 domain-containing protein n=1 Tax=Prosthecobacter sp. TaxID=1965333 RepID=UPI002AC8B128|nr:SH3 domain-containing protein [Prosthecobacter sp.]
MHRPSLIQFGLFLGMALLAVAGEKGVINDPDGFTNLRAGPSADAAVVARVNADEPFEFEEEPEKEWWKVTLASGKTGWMHSSRIRLHFTLDEIPEKDEEGCEVGEYAKARGFDYNATARAAAKGEPAAMKRYFGINDTDGAASESHSYCFNTVIHILGDDKLAAFLSQQPLDYRLDVRHHMGGGEYAERTFPKTAKLLFQKELVDWPSPDGRYAIRKVFSDAQVDHTSKVVRAEVIEKATGKAIADLTDADIGKGAWREGRVLWSPDSKRFAFFSGAQASTGSTVVYEDDGKTFTRAKLPEVKFPGRDTDAELKNAKHEWAYVEPLRWERPDVLVLSHHDYFRSKHDDGSLHDVGRTYEITHDFTKREATAKVRRFDE